VQATDGGTATDTTERPEATAPTPWFQRRALAAAVIALLLVALSFLNDPSGYLGTDTGGKVATLEAMVERGDWSVDVGYWAEEHDPDGTFHPQYGTTRTEEGWVQVTSLPMVLAARPLYDVGGYRAALVLPIAGSVLAALAAAALAGRLGRPADATRALWLFGLGSPLLVYGLDLWEHSLGVAAIGWAVVLLYDVAFARRSPCRAVGAGGLLAAAATMRTEALVYALVVVAAVSLWLLARRRPVEAVVAGAAAAGGFTPVWLLNSAMEDVLGGNSRTSRATGAASAGVASGDSGELGLRLEEGLRTTFATAATDSWSPVLLGMLLTVGVVAAVSAGRRISSDRVPLVALGLGTFTVLVVAPGLGFVPGLFAAFPVAAAAFAVRGPAPGARVMVAAAVATLPVVWAFQFIGGAGPQWGGRYVLGSMFLLGVVGVVSLGQGDVPRPIALTVVAMSVVVNLFGAVWLWDRSHEVADLFDRIIVVQEEALVARNRFILREAGPRSLDHRWLSAADPADLEGPADVLRDAGLDRFSVLQVEGQPVPDVEGADVTGSDRIPALGVVFEVVHLRFRP
jgi:hypothetical protein